MDERARERAVEREQEACTIRPYCLRQVILQGPGRVRRADGRRNGWPIVSCCVVLCCVSRLSDHLLTSFACPCLECRQTGRRRRAHTRRPGMLTRFPFSLSLGLMADHRVQTGCGCIRESGQDKWVHGIDIFQDCVPVLGCTVFSWELWRLNGDGMDQPWMGWVVQGGEMDRWRKELNGGAAKSAGFIPVRTCQLSLWTTRADCLGSNYPTWFGRPIGSPF